MVKNRKLIRDNYAQRLNPKGARLETVTDPEVIDSLLIDKVIEELNELQEAIDNKNTTSIALEAADAIEAILARATLHGVPSDEVEKQRIIKRESLGGFENGVLLVKEE